MVNNRRSNRRGGRPSKIQEVRIADNVAGRDGLRADRMVTAVKESESQTRIVIGDFRDLNATTTGTADGTYGFDEIFATDDFVSMIQQYNLFRIKSIKFEIFDINTGAAVYNSWGVWHDDYQTTVPTYTRQNVTDLPDSRILSAGTGQTTLYWMAHGTEENRFQANSTAGAPINRFGGLKYFIGGVTTASAKYILNVHAVVDFRGRR